VRIKQPGDVLIQTKHTTIDFDGTARIREAEVKGDVAGHEFHGNRFTGGLGRGGDLIGGSLRDHHDPALVAAMDKATQDLVPLTKERAVMLAKDGHEIWTVNGNADTITVTGPQVSKLAAETATNGGVVGMHNHPSGSGTSFSPTDVSTGFRFGMSEMRLVASPYVYVMRPGKLATSDGKFERVRGADVIDYAAHLNNMAVLAHQDTTWHDIWRQVSDRYGMEYFRVALGDKERMAA
jgi:hypothetical protein